MRTSSACSPTVTLCHPADVEAAPVSRGCVYVHADTLITGNNKRQVVFIQNTLTVGCGVTSAVAHGYF